MRFYSFVNANYLKHVQHGLQTAHALHEMYEKYLGDVNWNGQEAQMLHDWARNHKTIIILDGGDCEDLKGIYNFLKANKKALRLPFSCFHEDKRSLNGALTAVAVVVPPQIYEVTIASVSTNGLGESNNNYRLIAGGMLFGNYQFPNPETEEFYHILKSKSLAR